MNASFTLLDLVARAAHIRRRHARVATLLAGLLLAGAVQAQAPLVATLSPARNAHAAPRTTAVAVRFTQPLGNTAPTRQALHVFGQQTGRKAGTAAVRDSTLRFLPNVAFKPGESVWVTVTTGVESLAGTALAHPQVYQFTAAAASGPGTFSGGSDVPIGNTPSSLAVGDVDKDGDLDVLTVNYPGTVSVRLNQGAGTYSGSQEVAVGSNPYRLVLGDLDGDGDLDLVTTNVGSSTLSVRVNNGEGLFSGNQQVPTGGLSNNDLALGDVDGDGDLDLVAAHDRQAVSVRLNDGQGLFGGTQEVAIGPGQLRDVALGDADQDGDLDLFVLDNSSSRIRVRFNTGAGVFGGTRK